MKTSSFTIIVSFLCLALAGLAFIPLLPVKLAPSHTLPSLSVSYSLPYHSSRVIEMEVTSRLEAMLSRVKGIKEIRSTSGNGWGRINIQLDKHTDPDAARFEVSTIIRQTWPDMPDGLSYPTVQMSRPDDSEARPFISYTLNAASSPAFIQRYAENNIKPVLSGVKGIYRIDISGATPMEWQIEYDSHQLTALGITVTDIQTAISNFYRKEFLGVVTKQEGGMEWIRLALIPENDRDKFDPSLIMVAGSEGKLYRLDQLLKVVRQEEAPQSYYRINGLNSVYLSLYADETANQLNLAKRVKETMSDLRTSLPPGYEIHTSYDATEYIQNELNRIYIRTGLTVIILLVFVLLLTRNMRYLFLIVTSLTMNLCIAVIFYYLCGLEMQLYSLAGITISLSLIIDNTIVMSDHIKNRQNRNAFLPILAATLTTIGALVIIFFLDEKIRLNLQDFAAVVIINLSVSLFVAWFFVPAMIEKTSMFRKKTSRRAPRLWMKRIIVHLSHFYIRLMRFCIRWRVAVCAVLILAFGLPVYMIPEKINMKKTDNYSHRDSVIIEKYNELLGNKTFKEKVRPIIEKSLGGSLRLFVQKVYEGSYFPDREETVLNITASLPNGSTLQQMNNLISRMEAYLSSFHEIRQFQTRIMNARQARIDVYFTKENAASGFPYVLKSNVISKALELGGGSWGVYGLQDQGFSNDVRESAGSNRIEMLGYNYDELYGWALQLRDTMLTYRRIKEVFIRSDYSWYKDDYQEYTFNFNKERMAQANVRPYELFASVSSVFGRDISVGSIVVDSESEKLKLTSRQSYEYDIWNMQFLPLQVGSRDYKLSQLATVEKGQTPQDVSKINQQYRLCLQYEYIGASTQGQRIQSRILETFNELMPMGYSAKGDAYSWRWGEKDSRQFFLLLLVIVIIFFTTGILFNSLKQPLAVICVIPVSYIGVFLTFYLFHLNFDQGGFASFILLCGITVNASIYILNEYNRIRETRPLMPPIRAYLKAWNAKITPIFLTVVSTVLGFIPFLVGKEKEAFWFPLAAGAIGGLLMSIIGVYLFLPIFSLKKRQKI